jgi:hypothetical protein
MKITPTHPPIAFAWYTREDWERLWETAPDRHDLDESFDAWELAAVQAELEFQAMGVSVTRVPVKAGPFIEWCRLEGRTPTRASRSAYVAAVSRMQSGADG